MKTAILTGASSGLGIQFARQLKRVFPEVEELWLIARRQDRLEALAAELTDLKTVVLPLDLCREESFTVLREKLAAEQPDVVLLLNNAGCGYLGNVGEGPLERQTTMIDLNVRALTAITHLTLPYMKAGAHILSTSSIASFCANARLNTYSATKAYVSSFTRGLSFELRNRGISATAVCPGPLATEFVTVGGVQRLSTGSTAWPPSSCLTPWWSAGPSADGVSRRIGDGISKKSRNCNTLRL